MTTRRGFTLIEVLLGVVLTLMVGGVTYQLGDIGEGLAAALQSLADEAAGLVGSLPGELVAAFPNFAENPVSRRWLTHDQCLLVFGFHCGS